MSFYEPFIFILLVFASFRLTRLIVFDKITQFIRAPFINEWEAPDENGELQQFMQIKGEGLQAWIGKLLSCYWCTGMWVSIFLYSSVRLIPTYAEPIVGILALAGAASIVETLVTKWLES
ncbi:MAG: DUF1360 domain-containing protein [Bacilli bacterium]